MPKEPLDPFTALDAIRTYAKVALTNDKPSLDGFQTILTEILNVCDQAQPKKVRRGSAAARKGE